MAYEDILSATSGTQEALDRRLAEAKAMPAYRNIANVKPTQASGFGTAGYTKATGLSVPKAAVQELGAVSVPYGGKTRYEKSFHKGIDFAKPIGTKVPSFTGGKVVEVVTGKKQGDAGYGNYVTVKDAYGNRYRYSHLNEAWVRVGDDVAPGLHVGSIGNTGSTYSVSGGSGAHLDFRVVDAYGRFVDPTATIRSYYGV